MPYADINGVSIYHELHGDSGEPLVLVHGYTGDITDWRHQLPVFSSRHRILIFDNRGHGRSEAPEDRSAYTVQRMSQDAEALAQFVGFDRYHLLGHSMGGAVAQEVALRSPGKLISLTLHSSAPRFDLASNAQLAMWIDFRLQVAERQGMRALAEIEAPLAPPPHMPAERAEETKERLARMSADAFVGAWQGLTEWQGTVDRLAGITTPTLIIYGDLDAEPLREGAALMARLIPNSRMEIVPETGHSPQWERPELYNAALSSFLAQHATSALAG